MKQTLHLPIVSIIAVMCYILLQEDVSVPVYELKKGEKTFSDLLRQFFGRRTKATGRLDVGKILMWTTLIFVDLNMGFIFTVLILLIAFVNFPATQYLRGNLELHYCCSSYAYWFFSGASLSVIAYRSFEININHKMIKFFVVTVACSLGPVLILLKALSENTLLSHAFPFLMGYVISVLMIFHVKFSKTLHEKYLI